MKRRKFVSRWSSSHSDSERGDCVAANARRAETEKRIYTANGEMVAVVKTSV